MKVSIIGVTGYSGIELVRLLLQHPKVTIVSIHSHSQNGQQINDYLPHLKQLLDLPLEPIDPADIMKRAELVFLPLHQVFQRKLQPHLLMRISRD